MTAEHSAGEEKALDFQDLMRKATQIKEAQLAERRKEWTAAPLFLKATLSPPEDIVRVRQHGNEDEKLAAMQDRKERGNEKFREEDYDAAQVLYSEAIAVVHYFEQIGEDMPFRRSEDSFSDDCVEGVIATVSVSSSTRTPPREAAGDLLCQCYSNIAACLFRQKRLPELYFAAGKAIELRPESAAKAYYRRGYAKLLFGSLDDLDAAQRDLHKALLISPEDSQIKRALKKLGQERIKYKARSRKVFSKAFRHEEAPDSKHNNTWAGFLRALITGTRRAQEDGDGDGEPNQDYVINRTYRCLLFALILLSAVFLVRFSINIYKLTMMTIYGVDEL